MKKVKVLVGKVLWVLSVVAFVLAWVAVALRAPIGPLDPLFLLWNALILGVLAIPLKLSGEKGETQVGGVSFKQM